MSNPKRKFEDFLFEVQSMAGLNDVPPEVVMAAVKKATIELCEVSHIWREVIPVDIQSGVNDYPIDLPDSLRLVSVEYIQVAHSNCCSERGQRFFNGCCNNKYYPRRRDGECACWFGRSFRIVDQNTLVITPTPNDDVSVGLNITCFVKPTQESCELSEELWQDWQDVIGSGAKARLFMMNKQPWTNLGLANTYMKMFAVGKTRAKNARTTRNIEGGLFLKGTYF